MNTILALKPVDTNLLRVNWSSLRSVLFVNGGKIRLSHCSSSCAILISNNNHNPVHLPRKLQYDHGRIPSKRNKSRKHSTATILDRKDEGDEIHRYRYHLYKYKICPFSNIARVFLEYQMIPFEPVEVNPLTKAELGFSVKYRKVPIVSILDSASETPKSKALQQLNGTEEILAHDYQDFETGTFDDDEKFSSSHSSIQWLDFARNRLSPLLYPNLCRTLGDSFRAFEYVHSDTNNFSAIQRYSIQYIGSVAMYFAASKVKEKHNLDDVQAALEEALTELESELSKEGSTFLRPDSSEVPHLGDLAVFGVLKGLEGMPLWIEIFENENNQIKYSNIRRWYINVDNVIETRKSRTPRYGFDS